MDKAKVMVVLEDYVLAKDLQHRLTRLGYRVPNIVFTVDEILISIEKEDPAVVLLDASLKGTIDSLEMATMIKQRYNIPIIMLHRNGNAIAVKKTEGYYISLNPIQEREISLMIDLVLSRKTIETQALPTDGLIQFLFHHNTDAIILTDEHLLITQINGPATILSGWTEEEAMGKYVKEVLCIMERNREDCDCIDYRLIREKKMNFNHDNYLILSKKQEKSPVNLTTMPLKNRDGVKTGFLFHIKFSRHCLHEERLCQNPVIQDFLQKNSSSS